MNCDDYLHKAAISWVACVFFMWLNALKTYTAAQKKKKIPLAGVNVRLPRILLGCKIQLQIHVSETRLCVRKLSQRRIAEALRADGLSILSLC